MLVNQAIIDFVKYMKLIDRSKATIRGYELELVDFNNFIMGKHNGPVYMEDLKLQDLEDYLYFQKERGIASSSRSRSLYILRSFYNYCCKKDICRKNLASLLEPVKVYQKEKDFITEEEFEELVKAIKHPVIRTAIQTIFYTGGRISETINLKLEDVDLKNNIVHIIEGKGKKDRDVPINHKLHSILTNYLDNIRETEVELGMFFATKKTGKLSATYINESIYEAVDKLGWEKQISAHILRHSFGTNLLNKGASVVSIQKLLGHANLRATSRYLHHNMEQLSEAVNLL